MGVLIFFIMIVVLIVGHEFGHLLAAKRAGMEVPEFGIGFPPKLWSFVRGATEYSINALPFGGFVRITGENGDADHPNAFSQKTKIAQLGVLAAGPGANIVIAFIAFWIAFMVGLPTVVDDAGPQGVTDARVVVTQVLPNSPAAEGGVTVGDSVLSILSSGITHEIERPSDILDALSADEPVTLTLEKSGVRREVELTPRAGIISDAPDTKALGVGTMLLGLASYDVFTSFGKAFIATINGLWQIVLGFTSLIAGAFTLSASLEDVSGPVGIASLAGDAVTFGIGQVLSFAAIISLNLAVLNLLPFPALDGGRIVMVVYEALRGRAIRQVTANLINSVGFVLLIGLMLVVTWNDVVRLVS